jgi:hypothetical protein
VREAKELVMRAAASARRTAEMVEKAIA